MSVTQSGVGRAGDHREAFVCLGPDCEEIFTRGKGGKRSDAKYCSVACRKRAERAGYRLTPIDKAAELSDKAARLQTTIEEALADIRAMGERQDHLANAYSIANAVHVAFFLNVLDGLSKSHDAANMEAIP